MKNMLFIMSLVLITVSCSRPWKDKNEDTSIILPDIKIIEGKHCESSAMLNMLTYLGYPVNESMIAGGGGAPSFMYQKGDFPFLGGRNTKMREVFFENAGIKYHVVKTFDPASSWNGVIEVLKKGIPVILRVDMRFLPYRYGGKYGPAYMSFGWHMITLFGIDTKKDKAYVSDTEFKDLLEIKISDLEKARSSKTKVYPPEREYYWAEKKPDNYSPDWNKLTKNGINTYISNMEDSSGAEWNDTRISAGLEGLKNLGAYFTGIEDYVKPYLLSPALQFLYGSIETHGTGGAAFRNFLRDFIAEGTEKTGDKELEMIIPFAEGSIDAWHKLSGEIKKASEVIKNKKKEERAEIYKRISETAVNVYEKEEKLVCQLKKWADKVK
jgi:hypothetical protein